MGENINATVEQMVNPIKKAINSRRETNPVGTKQLTKVSRSVEKPSLG